MSELFDLIEETPSRWRLEPRDAMRVPVVVFASRELLPKVQGDQSLQQAVNVATLPGVVDASYAMPDMHWGYGFPIGGVAATDVEHGGVISPGGVGFDISCGVRLLVSELDRNAIGSRLPRLMDACDRHVPSGLGRGGVWKVGARELRDVLVGGARYAVERGHGVGEDVDRCEDRGALPGADPDQVGDRARERGLGQIGSLGSGNHFLEVQVVDEVADEGIARTLGLELGRVCVMIHSGSRGLGHQICTDHVRTMTDAMQRYGIQVPDRQLACAPVDSPEGRAYLGAMAAAANYGRANRQLLTVATRRAFDEALGLDDGGLRLLYDVSHNLAKIERHEVAGETRLVCVHRKGATLALPPGHADLPAEFRDIGQPVLIPGSMGTASWVLVGGEPGGAFHSAAHGAGRALSRKEATRRVDGRTLRKELEAAGVTVRSHSWRGLAEEAPVAYKDVDQVVATCEQAGLARRVARLRPIGVVKG